MERAKLLSKWTADIPYYLFASVYKNLFQLMAFIVSKDQDFFPKILGGKDNFPDYVLGSYLCAFKR